MASGSAKDDFDLAALTATSTSPKHARKQGSDVPKLPPISKRLQELLTSFAGEVSMSLGESGDWDQSSYGLIPKSLMDFSVSGNSSLGLSTAHNPSIAADEPGDHALSDDVFAELGDTRTGGTRERQAGDGKEELSRVKSTMTEDSLSKSTVIFCDDQISARSSVSDKCRHSEGDRVSAVATEMLSKLFRRYSLDTSTVASSPVDNFTALPSVVRVNQTRSLALGSQCEAISEAAEELPASNNDDSPSKLLDSRFLRASSISSDLGVDGDFGGADNESFVAAESALEIFERDEEVFKKERAFVVPNQIVEDQANVLRQSWMANDNHDITRPSWFTSCGENGDTPSSRVSIGAFLRAKTEDLGTFGDFTDISLVSTSPPKHFEPLSVTNMIEQEYTTCDLTTDSMMNSMSKLVADASFGVEPDLLIARLMKMADEKKTKRVNSSQAALQRHVSARADPSGASESTEHMELMRPSITPNENVADGTPNRPDDWIVLRSIKKPEKDNEVLLMQQSLMPCDLDNCSPLTQHPQADNLFPVKPIALHLLRTNSRGCRPSLDVPTNHVFSEPCVAGASLTQCLPLHNSGTLWMEGSTELLSLQCNGRPFHPADGTFIFDARWTVEPAVDKLFNVTFSPPAEGKWTAKLRISCRQISSSDWHVVSLVSLEAVAERPRVDVHPVGFLEFGRLPEQSLCTRTLNIVSKCKAVVPVRLVIEGESGLGQGFYFAATRESCSDLTPKQVVGPSEIVCSLNGSKSIAVHLKTPTILDHEDEVQVMRTNMRVDLDCSGSVVTLATVLLRAVVGVLRLYTPQDVEPIPLQPAYDLPLQNRGPIPVHVELRTRHPDLVSVMPEALLLEPRQKSFVRLMYHPLGQSEVPLKSVVQMRVQPDGPCYEMHLIGLSQTNVSSTSSASSLQRSAPLHFVLNSDRRNVQFSTVPLGQTEEKTVTLHNVSTTFSLPLRLQVQSNSTVRNPPPFYVATSDGLRSIRLTDLTLRPNEKLPIVVRYAPAAVSFNSASLVIKPINVDQRIAASGKIKFVIPLMGFGGSTNVVWDGVDQTQPLTPNNSDDDHDNCDWIVNQTTSNGEFTLTARNRGQRHAFVKILVSQVPTLTPTTAATNSLPPVSVRPSHFVLPPGGNQRVNVAVGQSVPHSSTLSFYLGLFFGDEILRQRFRLYCRNQMSANDSALERLLLKDHFLGEEVRLLDDHHEPSPSRSDFQFLVSNMQTKWVAVLPSLFLESPPSNYQEQPSRIFMPLVPEQTFNDTSTFTKTHNPVSPPTRDIVALKIDTDVLDFPTTKCGSSNSLKLSIKNPSNRIETANVVPPSPPFEVRYSTISVKERHYLSLPIVFRPQHPGTYSSKLVLRTVNNTSSVVHLVGVAARS